MKCAPQICISLLLGMVLLLMPGCSRNTIVPVSGTVTVQGKPAANIRVTFQPIATGEGLEAAGPGALGITDANGHYEMEIISTRKTGKGATVGQNRVYLAPSGDNTGDALPSLSQGHHHGIPKFPWGEVEVETTIDIPAGGTSSADFSLPLAKDQSKKDSI